MPVPRITAAELKDRLDRGEKTLVLDTRSDGAYSASSVRIPGSVRVSVSELEDRVDEFDREHLVVAYCT